MAQSSVVSADALRDFAARVLRAVGMQQADAELVADAMVWCDLRGIEPHGLAKLPLLVARIQAGGTSVDEPCIFQQGACTAVMDGHAAWGQLVATRAMELAVELAQASRVGIVVVRNSSSLGALGYYPLVAVRAGMIGLAITNSMPLLAPTGGARKLLGNQAYAIGCPAGRHHPLLLDTSNSATSWGWVKVARERGEQLKPGLALDREGRPTVDPAEALEGLLLPAGGHKGYGLALMWEVLTGVLAGMAYGPSVGNPEVLAEPQEVSHFLMALDPAAFLDREAFLARVDDLIDQVHAVPPAPGVERVYAPGERGFLAAERREQEGVELSRERREQLKLVAERVGVNHD
jgi:LDH2 family malate/lactate/ureidoglycolate dehydrogenase